MTIGLFSSFAGRNCGGPEVYERELIRAVLKLPADNEYHVYCLDRRGPETIGCEDPRLRYHRMGPRNRVVAMVTSLPAAIRRTSPAVFHALMVPPPFCPPKTIMAMQCSSVMLHPELYPPLIRFRLQFLLHRAVPKAELVLCPSRHVLEVTRDYFRLSEDRLAVLYPGANNAFRPLDPEPNRQHLREKFGIDYPYFLFSGRWEKRKNLTGVLKAFAIFKRQRGAHRLVLTGGLSWHAAQIQAQIRALGLEREISDLGKTDFDELPRLYAGAEALLYPSLWEGFGLPIVEAMRCGTPVITSNISAMPETAGGAALLVDPRSPEDIAAAMTRVLDPELRERLRRAGPEQAKRFSWDEAARQVLGHYARVGAS
jgi:glycosyltransferase involved in cell wall biosynthesis